MIKVWKVARKLAVLFVVTLFVNCSNGSTTNDDFSTKYTVDNGTVMSMKVHIVPTVSDKRITDVIAEIQNCVITNNYYIRFNDEIIASWGMGSNAVTAKTDAFNCIKAALDIRNALLKMNAKYPDIYIVSGINTGSIYIGMPDLITARCDTVNFAREIVDINTDLGTDILIPEDVWALVGDMFITEEMPPVKVKGKEKPIRIFAIINSINSDGPKTLADLKNLMDTPDFNKADMDAEETKYEIYNS